jgi:hypothetical protein
MLLKFKTPEGNIAFRITNNGIGYGHGCAVVPPEELTDVKWTPGWAGYGCPIPRGKRSIAEEAMHLWNCTKLSQAS